MEQLSEKIWEDSISLIKKRVNNHNFDTWIKPMKLISVDDSTVEILVPNKFFQDWLNDNYRGLIIETIKEVSNKDFAVFFKVKKEGGRYLRSRSEQSTKDNEEVPAQEKETIRFDPFDRKYTFDNFVAGSSNQFAKAACLAVSNNPGKTYNPLFIYGGVGLGKTHLLCAVGNQILLNHKKTKILYVTSEKFTNEVINAIRFDKMTEFKNKYRSSDVLLIDDIQFIAGKERTQEEFFHTFNSLFEHHKQIVLTSDSFPKEIEKLDERLRSRFEWGLIADIQPPELELRVAILKNKAEKNAFYIPDEVAFFIASNIKSNIRELEGSLTSVEAFSSLTGEDISVELARKVLKIKEVNRNIGVDEIQKIVASHFNIKVSDLKSQRKLKLIAVPRQIAMYLCRSLTDTSYPEIGREFGNKDHSTVIYAFNKISDLIKSDKQFSLTVNNLKDKLSK